MSDWGCVQSKLASYATVQQTNCTTVLQMQYSVADAVQYAETAALCMSSTVVTVQLHDGQCGQKLATQKCFFRCTEVFCFSFRLRHLRMVHRSTLCAGAWAVGRQ